MCTQIFYCGKIFAKDLKKFRGVKTEEQENQLKFKIVYDPKEDFDEIYLKFELTSSNGIETAFGDCKHPILFQPVLEVL